MYRNVYGAAFAFAPFLEKPTTDAILQHGLCSPQGDLRSILPDETRPIQSATIHIHPRGTGPKPQPLTVECSP